MRKTMHPFWTPVVCAFFAASGCGQDVAQDAAQDAARPPAAPAQNEELRQELIRRRDEDQAARKAMIEFMQQLRAAKKPIPADHEVFQRVHKADKENTAWLQGVVEKHGWPGKTLVGTDGAFIAWLLVQHADRDLKFQRECLDLMKAMPPGEVEPRNLAYLTDRVLLAEGKKQIYGTQFVRVNGEHKPQPLEDEANVDQRRKEVGLDTLAEYRKQLEAMYGNKDKDGEKKPENKP